MSGDQTQLHISGKRTTGLEVRTENVIGASSVANILKTSYGPLGLDKMLVTQTGTVTISNDGATILKNMNVEHPAAKVLVDLAQLQDKEVGDGTTTVVIIAAELLKRAHELIKGKIHPTTVISGYRHAVTEAASYLTNHLSYKVEDLGQESLVNAASTSLSSKILGSEGLFFSRLAVDALQRVRTPAGKYPVKSVNILKAPGKGTKDSFLVPGYALNCTRASEQMPRSVKNAKIAFVDFNLNVSKMQFGVKIIANNPKDLDEIRQREADIAKEHMNLILKAGANVVLCTKGIDDLVMKYLVEAGAIGVRRCKKEDLRRIVKATGGSIITTLANLEGEESFDAEALGEAAEVLQERIADEELILVKEPKVSSASSVILRGANSMMLDEMERAFHDALCVVKRTLESGTVVPGGGAVETALSVHLEQYALTLANHEQVAYQAFADALLIIPKILAINAAQDAIELVSRLRATHSASQTDTKKAAEKSFGLDLLNGVIRDNVAAGVLEPLSSKVKAYKFATEAAISILRIDDLFKLNPKEKPQDPHAGLD